MADKRLVFIDNIRIFLTAVVILTHLTITYGAPGGWYYREFEIYDLELIPRAILIIIAAINQAYYMGFFFLLSGYFSARSISTKDIQTFLSRRLVRLGVPILLCVYLISPLLRLFFRRIAYNIPLTLDSLLSIYGYIKFGYELGPMWFIMLLLIFSLVLPFLLKGIKFLSNKIEHPGRSLVIATSLITGLLTFLVRIPFPIGTVFQPLNLQTPHLIQYMVMFLSGAFIYLAGWNEYLPQISLELWGSITIGLLAAMPVLFFLVGGISGDVSSALGGFTWQSLVFSLWEQIFCFSMIAALLAFFFRHLNKSTRVTRELVSSSYATYIIHPLVLVIFTALLKGFHYPPLLKITLLAVPALILSFFAASVIRRLPIINSIL